MNKIYIIFYEVCFLVKFYLVRYLTWQGVGCTLAETVGGLWVTCSVTLHTIPSRQGLSLDLALGWQPSPQDPLSLPVTVPE